MDFHKADWFIDRLSDYLDKQEAIIWKGNIYSYKWLVNKINDWSLILEEKNIKRGNIISLLSDYTPDTIALFLALMKNGNVIVPFSYSLTEEERKNFSEIAEAEYLIKFSDNEKWNLIDLNRGDIKNDLMKAFTGKKKAGLVVFSSGSTGKSKAILHDMAKLLKKFSLKRHTLRTITFLLLDHLGGINTLLYILSNGGSIVTLDERNPSRVCEIIEKHRVELLPASPTFLNLILLSEAYKNYDLSSLKMITYGTEPIMESTLKKLTKILPQVKFIQTYGLSELGVLRSKSRDNASKWFKIGGEDFDIRIVNDELLIKAESSMEGYLNAPDPFDEEGYFHTGDIVEVDGDYIKILGRISDIINVAGQKVFPVEVENIILQMPEVEDVMVYGENNPITGQIVAARIKSRIDLSSIEMKKRIKEFCKNSLSAYKIPVRVKVDEELNYSVRYKKIRR